MKILRAPALWCACYNHLIHHQSSSSILQIQVKVKKHIKRLLQRLINHQSSPPILQIQVEIQTQQKYLLPGVHKLWQPGSLASRKWRDNDKMKRKWRGNRERVRKWREIHFLHFLIFSLFPSSLSISYIKNCLILSQNVKYGTFIANVTKNLTYAL